MSRKVDVSNPESWDEEDVIYLRDRGRLPQGYELPRSLQAKDGGFSSSANAGATGSFVDDELEEDLADMTKAELQREAASRDLDTDGTKAELVERIQSFDSGS